MATLSVPLTKDSQLRRDSITPQQPLSEDPVVTKDPRLHLVWICDRVFVKRLPPYLLSHLFLVPVFVDGAIDPAREDSEGAVNLR